MTEWITIQILAFLFGLMIAIIWLKKEKHKEAVTNSTISLETLQTKIQEVIQNEYNYVSNEEISGACRSVGLLALSRVRSVVDGVDANTKETADTHTYIKHLKKELLHFQEHYQGEDESYYNCEVSNGEGYAGALVNGILALLTHINKGENL